MERRETGRGGRRITRFGKETDQIQSYKEKIIRNVGEKECGLWKGCPEASWTEEPTGTKIKYRSRGCLARILGGKCVLAMGED